MGSWEKDESDKAESDRSCGGPGRSRPSLATCPAVVTIGNGWMDGWGLRQTVKESGQCKEGQLVHRAS